MGPTVDPHGGGDAPAAGATAARGIRAASSLYIADGSFEKFCEAVVGDSQFALFAARTDGTLVFVNDAMGALLGMDAAECIGRNTVEWLHPDELERAAGLMELSGAENPPPGLGRFRVRHASGEWLPLEVAGGLVSDGGEHLLVVYGRNGAPRVALEDVLALLLRGLPLAEVLRRVCNLIEWDGYGTHVSIAWPEADGFQQVTTGLPDQIAGADGDAGTIWSRCRETMVGVLGRAEDLDPARQSVAADLGVSEVWVEPVSWDEDRPPATVTIWTVGHGRSPLIHTYGMELAINMVELILRWTHQQRELEVAARRDSLTGLANRKVFFDTLSTCTDGGAVLYCDLDLFKPVNDLHGHATGDEILRLVSARVRQSVRGKDVVARLGGDEFAVICVGASLEEATEVAVRIQETLARPFAVGGLTVEVGVSIGIAQSDETLTETLVDAADRALSEAKAAGRATYRVAP
jgi:diguanylate cyclase (GGDEF)-like protein/PAS domain S-box-containing protein